MDELAGETVAMLSGKTARGRAFGRQIAFNVIPQVDAAGRRGACRARSGGSGRRRAGCLGVPHLAVNATAVRVPVFFGHSLAVHAAFERPRDGRCAALDVLRRGSGISVIDPDSSAEFPTPATLATAPDRVYLGRVRSDSDP